ncbi:hypothetical protein KP509_11G078600 [Ceratopteris richardii]|uniref:Uncharacterized protein n=1 Tax=Ceratopteris richardii TaxID=49495 RepID=A0A8T2TWH9_CERRI|nr:hypothetical protein KP509_11G078600 [Ceratopteris richardii]
MEDQKTETAKERRVESLGWLTESSVMPKKRKVIEGVGASSIIELRAQLYRTQEDARRFKAGDPDAVLHRPRKKTDTFTKKNAGVEERCNRDKLQLKAESDGSASYAALEKKAQLYEKLVRGEFSDEEDREKYSVDFLRKGFLEDEFKVLEDEGAGDLNPTLENNEDQSLHDSSSGRRSGIGWNPNKGVGFSQEHKALVKQVNEETIEAREQAAVLKQRRQIIAQKNREKLKQAFIKKKLEKLLAAEKKQTEDNSHLQLQ